MPGISASRRVRTVYGPMLDGALRYALSETMIPPWNAKHARPYKLPLPLNLAGCGAGW
jgi:hypothetical protein